jgi:hypothetical protein
VEIEHMEAPASWMETVSLFAVLSLCDLLQAHSPTVQHLAWNLSAVCAHSGLLYRLQRGDTPLLKLCRTLASHLFGVGRNDALPQWGAVPQLPGDERACMEKPLSVLGQRPYLYAVLHGHQSIVMHDMQDDDDDDDETEQQDEALSEVVSPVLISVLAENKLLFHALKIAEDKKSLALWLSRNPSAAAAGHLMMSKYPEDSDSDEGTTSSSSSDGEEEDEDGNL